MESTQAEQHTDRIRRKEDKLRKLWDDTKCLNIYITDIPGRVELENGGNNS